MIRLDRVETGYTISVCDFTHLLWSAHCQGSYVDCTILCGESKFDNCIFTPLSLEILTDDKSCESCEGDTLYVKSDDRTYCFGESVVKVFT